MWLVGSSSTKKLGQLLKSSARTRRDFSPPDKEETCTPDGVHSSHVGNGWAGIGYHYLVRKDGTIYRGRPEDTVGAHAYGANSHSIGVCFEGNYEVEQSTPAAQLAAGQALVADIKRRWGITKVIGHKDVDDTFKHTSCLALFRVVGEQLQYTTTRRCFSTAFCMDTARAA